MSKKEMNGKGQQEIQNAKAFPTRTIEEKASIGDIVTTRWLYHKRKRPFNSTRKKYEQKI